MSRPYWIYATTKSFCPKAERHLTRQNFKVTVRFCNYVKKKPMFLIRKKGSGEDKRKCY